jgi:hypothetical protein
MLHAAVGRDDALLDVVAPHLSVHKLPQKMRVHYRKFWGDDERGPFLGYDSVGTPPAMTRRTNMLDWAKCYTPSRDSVANNPTGNRTHLEGLKALAVAQDLAGGGCQQCEIMKTACLKRLRPTYQWAWARQGASCACREAVVAVNQCNVRSQGKQMWNLQLLLEIIPVPAQAVCYVTPMRVKNNGCLASAARPTDQTAAAPGLQGCLGKTNSWGE